MGCGMGGCYSCVVPRPAAAPAATSCARASTGPVFDASTVVWDALPRRDTEMADLSVQLGSLQLRNPLIAASGCFGYGVEYADAVDLAVARRRGRQGALPRRARRPSAAAHRRDAGRHAERDRPAGHRRASLRRARSCPSCAGSARRRSSTSADRRSTSTARSRACCRTHEGVARDRAEHLLPEHQGRRHPVRLQPDGHVRRRQRACAR